MGWSAFGNTRQANNNSRKHAFEKTQKADGKRMKKTTHLKLVNTNFDELLSIRKQNAQKKANSNRRFMFFIGLAVILTIVVMLWATGKKMPDF